MNQFFFVAVQLKLRKIGLLNETLFITLHVSVISTSLLLLHPTRYKVYQN